MSSAKIVWIVQLPPEYKAIFEELAKEEGDETHGAGARQLRKFLKQTFREDKT